MQTESYKPASYYDIDALMRITQSNNYYNRSSGSFPASIPPINELAELEDFKKTKFLGEVKIFCQTVNNQHTVYDYEHRQGRGQIIIRPEFKDKYSEEPYFFSVDFTNGQRSEECETKFVPSTKLLELASTANELRFFNHRTGRTYYYQTEGFSNIAIRVQFNVQQFYMIMPFEFAESVFGLHITSDFKLRLSNGTECDFKESCYKVMRNLEYYVSYQHTVSKFDFTYESLIALRAKLGIGNQNMSTLLGLIVSDNWSIEEVKKLSGIAKTWKVLQPQLTEMMKNDPQSFCACRSLAAMSGKSVDSVKISVIFNEVFGKVSTQEELKKALDSFYEGNSSVDDAIRKMPIFKEKRKAVLKSQGNRAFTKIQEESENLTIDKVKHKRTWDSIEAGEIPIGTFFRKSEQYFLLNDNWDLWEEMFKRGFKQEAIDLANEVKGRTTYEKDLMSYFYFVLYALPEYLKKQTGKKWKCIPKLVNSSEELEPPKEGSDGVARQRSALTPIVDNDALTVHVPYASLAIYGGRGTTYCYSHDYHVLTRGFSFHGYAVTQDVEEKLNGRDNYGLMFYTLTGSAQGQGYPTFLIIFEKRERFGDVRVHFHRTHPFRSKDGDYNPIHNWIAGCYNWMAGNIKANNIKSQQGDLFFVQVNTEEEQVSDGKTVKNLDFSYKVNQYDKHCFEREVPFAEYTKAAKSNILGYVKLESETWLKHTEHDDVLIPTGTYAIHQCRSWEANPKGVWSLRID